MRCDDAGPFEGRRLLISCVNYAPEVLGTAPYTRDMAAWFAGREWDVRVATTYPYYPEWVRRKGDPRFAYRVEHVDGVTVLRCPSWVPRVPGGLKRLAHYLSFALSSLPVALACSGWRPDVVLVVAPTLVSAPEALLAARLAGARSWLHVQDYELDLARNLGLLPGPLASMVFGRFESSLLGSFGLVSTITEPMLEAARRKGVADERLVLLPNWADLDVVRPLQRPSRLRGELGIADDRPVALYSGNLGRKQGVGLLVDTAQRAQDAGSQTVYVVSGDGAKRAELERAVAVRRLTNVRLLPLQVGDDFNELLNLADVHLIVQESGAADLVMPSKLTNMLASGRPVVVTAAEGTGLATLIQEHDLGAVVPPADGAALHEAVEGLLTDDALRARQGRNARAYAEQNLEKDRLLGNVLARLDPHRGS